MSVLFSLLSKKKDRQLRQTPAYLGLANLGYFVSSLSTAESGICFEHIIDGYVVLISLEQQHIVTTAFFKLNDERFEKKAWLIALIEKKGYLIDRNSMKKRTPFHGLSTRNIDQTVYPLLSILSHEDFPRMDRETVLQWRNVR